MLTPRATLIPDRSSEVRLPTRADCRHAGGFGSLTISLRALVLDQLGSLIVVGWVAVRADP
jgi:hypothetical protein